MKKNRLLLLLTLITSISFAEVPAEGENAPAPNYDQYFVDESSINPEGTDSSGPAPDFVGNDTMPTEIQGKYYYTSETGKIATEEYIDEKGLKKIVDKDSGEEFSYFYEQNKSKEYTEARDKYFKSVENNESIEEQRKKLKDAKMAAKNETFKHNYNVKQYEETLLKDIKPGADGKTIVNKFYLQPRQNATEAEVNASNFYRDNFTFSPDNASKEQIKDTNVGKLKKAYDLVKDYEQLANSKISNGIIQCYLSRELVPAFYCPYPDMTETKYPDFDNPDGDPLKVSSQEAEALCDSLCFKERSCVNYNVLEDTNYKPDISEKTIYPWSESDAFLTINTTDQMQVRTIEFDINVTKSDSFDGNETQFNEWLMNLGTKIKYRTTITRVDPEGKIPSEPLYLREDTRIIGSHIHKKYSISATSKSFSLLFYKAYVYEVNSPMNNMKENKILSNIKEIKVSNIKVNYTNTDIYFCPFRQLVNNSAECPNGKIIDISTGSGVLHICTNSDHKIGPDLINGGFYSEESCKNACNEFKKCKPTYKHYANMSINDLYKAKVGCVSATDSNSNAGCSEALCKDYFADGKKRPINEIVVQNDNNRVYTVKDKVITGEMRPKINYDEEVNSVSTDYNMTFQTEMKDQAFKSMVDNQSYDRIKYTIGTPSPRKQAYKSKTIGGKKNIEVIIKPNSYEFENGKSYRIYSIIRFEQVYRPAYGIFTIDGHYVDATTQPIQFKDETFMIKKNNDTWKVFKQINFSKVKSKKKIMICTSSDGTKTETDYLTDSYVPDNCQVQTQVWWSDVPAYKQDRNVFYDASSDTFKNYSPSEKANKFIETEFNSDMIQYRYKITEDIFGEMEHTPGAMIHSQIEKSSGASFARVYSGDYNSTARGYPANAYLYSFYADHDLTYSEILDELKDKNIVWELANPHKYRTEIKEDGEIRNNIVPFIVGDPAHSTVDLDIKPKFTEEGQRVFKFIFLYDPAKDPFE